jgi:uncharacterized membrane protein YgcG
MAVRQRDTLFHPDTQRLVADGFIIAAVNAGDVAARDRASMPADRVDWISAAVSGGLGLALELLGHYSREPAAYEVGDGLILGGVSIAARRAMAMLDANLLKPAPANGSTGSSGSSSGTGSSTGSSGSGSGTGSSSGSSTTTAVTTVGAGDTFTVG